MKWRLRKSLRRTWEVKGIYHSQRPVGEAALSRLPKSGTRQKRRDPKGFRKPLGSLSYLIPSILSKRSTPCNPPPRHAIVMQHPAITMQRRAAATQTLQPFPAPCNGHATPCNRHVTPCNRSARSATAMQPPATIPHALQPPCSALGRILPPFLVSS